MISYIHGVLTEVDDSQIVVEAAGVGYGIFVPLSVLPQLPPTGTDIRIYTCFHVKEDEQTLYGFLYKEDREMFRQLISVNGVGPKGALGILGILSPSDLRLAVATDDSKAISRAPGIGAKTAQKIILELRDKLGKLGTSSDTSGISGIIPAASQQGSSGPVAEAIEALTMLGYSRMEAGRAVGSIGLTPEMTTEDVLKAALKKVKTV